MRKLLFLLAAAITATSMMAAPVDQATAMKKAKSYLTNELYAGKIMAPAAVTPVLLKAEIGNTKLNQPVFYIYNTSTTFLVVAGDDRAEEILMIGDRPLKDINNLPPGMVDMLNMYKEQIVFLQEHPNMKVEPLVSPNNTPSLRATNVGPLLTALWDQEAPYYNQCTFTYNNRTYQCLTGCPATSASMVLYYWKYPTTATGTVDGYKGYLDLSSGWTSNQVSFTYSSLPSVTFDWANMLDSYSGSYTSAQGAAVATLMRYVGQAEEMIYGPNGSGISVDDAQNVADMFIRFGYDSSTTRLVKQYSTMDDYGNVSGQNYTDAQWAAIIQEEMIAGRPVVFMAVDLNNGGHAFNVDGYNSSSNKYHINFGWSGDGNDWCSLNAFGYGSGWSSYNFNTYQQMIIGIQPPSSTTPVLTVNPTSLSFTGASTGETYTKTFTVTGTDLRGDVSISSNNGTFTVSPSTITAAQAQNGATVTVTYKPTSSGTQNATITVSSSGADSKTVTVSGTATSTPKITVNPTSLSMTTTAGTSVTKTFTVTGTDLTGNVYLSLSGNGFSIDKSTISKTQAGQGATVTVTFNPSAVGNYSGTITLTSSGAQSVTVNLTGTATGVPTLTVNPTSLSFNATVGETVTKTFNVTGTDLNGSVYLSVEGTGFSIDKSTISQNAATNGTTVTVTYRPTTGGTHTGTVALSSNGAQQVTVALNGIATTVPTVSANPTTLDFVTTVGTPITKSFVLNSANLEGDVTLAVQGEGFTIDKTTIIPGAANNAAVNVTFTPTAFGTYAGTVNITSPNAQPVTVNLNGQANLITYAPVMLPVNDDLVSLTQFRADWTDETAKANVTSYTLEVSPKAVEPEVVLLHSLAGTSFSGSATGYYDITLPAPWGGTNVRGGLNSIIYFRNNYNNSGSYGNITYTIPDGYENATFTMKITTGSTNDGAGNLAVGTPQTASVNHLFTKGTTYSWVVTASAGEKITITSSDSQYSPEIALIEVYTGDATGAKLRAESGDYRLIPDITNKYYLVKDLTAGGTFLYRVKALYIDGTESDWSNIEEVTLHENEHPFEIGDVNHDGSVDVTDVTVLISYVLGNTTDICLNCADVDGDGAYDVSDVTALINIVLAKN